MNYLKQIIAFDKWEELHPLSDKAYRLWFKLMAIANASGWDEWLSVPLLKLKSELHTSSDQTIMNARNSLVQAGRIEVRKGKHGKSADYRLIPFAEDKSGVNTGEDSGVKKVPTNTHGVKTGDNSGEYAGEDSGGLNGVNTGDNSGAYYKQNKTKQNSSNSNTHTHEDVFNFWQRDCNWGFPNQLVTADLDEWINEFGPDLVIYAMTIAGKKQITASAADSFLNSVFKSWRQNNVKTIEDAKTAANKHEQNAYNSRQQRNNYGRSSRPREQKPGWMKQREEQKSESKKEGTTYVLPDDSVDPMPK